MVCYLHYDKILIPIYNYKMKKVYNYIVIALLACIGFSANAQTYYLHAEYRSDWYGTGYLMTEDIAGYPSKTLRAQSAADQFVIEADNGYNRWKKYGTTAVDVPAPFIFYPNAPGTGITDNYLDALTTSIKHYTTRIKNLNYASTNAVVMLTDSMPQNITGATQSPLATAVLPTSTVTVTVSIAQARSPQEKFFVRYTNNSWSTSQAVIVSFANANSLTGTATIPVQAANAMVSYYIMSSTLDVTSFTNTSDFDLVTLKLNNNSGANYNYTVGSPIAIVTAPITFQVNMTGQTVGTSVYLAGSFNNYSATATPMTLTTNGIYTATVNLDTTATVTYKFVNGTVYETVPATCGINDGIGNINRNLIVPNTATTLATVCLDACDNSCAAPIVTTMPITFKVNMSAQTVGTGVYLAGSFNNFSTTANPMMLTTGGVYTATVNLDTTATVTYKYVNGTTFETVSNACGVSDGFGGYNRSLSVPNAATTLATVCFGSCTNCPAPFNVNVTFIVNMTGQTVGAGVYLAGSFNNFSATANPMTLTTNSIYTTTLSLDTALIVNYKFVNGTVYETVPTTCGFNDGLGNYNRRINVPNSTSTLPTVCFDACNNNCAPVVVVTTPITFRVNMSTQTIGAGVYLAGSFNNFSATATPMTSIGGGTYEAVVNIDTTLTIAYKFVNGTVYETVPTACGFNDGNGNINRSLSVPNAATTLSTVCFGSCTNCPVPVLVATTFRVNMTGTTIGSSGVHIAGTFNGFSRTATAMTLTTNNIYEATLQLDSTATHYYKFLKDTSNTGWEAVPAVCGVTYNNVLNRKLVVANAAATIPTVCFAACDNSCAPVVVVTTPVTFRVNMSTQTIGAGVYLAGSFNNFSATVTPMTLTTNGIYTATVNLDTTATVTYKFVNGTTYENVASACGVSDGFGGYNRNLVVPNAATTLSTVCFGSCTNCPVPVLVATTFRVNMTGTTIGSGGVHIAATFNGFSRTATAMTLTTNNIYEATLQLDSTATHYYKFLKDTSNTGWEAVPAVCGVTYNNVLNRKLVVANAAATIPTVCFAACDNSCAPVVVVTTPVTFRVNMSTQTIGAGVYLAGSFNNFSATATPMTSIGGGVYEAVVNLDTTLTISYKFVNGTTFETVPTACGFNDGNGNINRSLSVPNVATTLQTVCFASCTNCPVPVLVPVTFSVNMSSTTIGAGGVHLAGTFNGFSRTATPMYLTINSIYTATVSLDTTATHYYKFTSDTSVTSYEATPAACGFTYQTVLNRKVEVPSTALNIATVCFGSCTNCPTAPYTVPVTFRVNMYGTTVSAQGVHIAGSFNNWNPAAQPLSNVGNSVYETTLNLDTTTTHQYKFVNGNITANYETVPAACGIADGFGGYNRNLAVSNAATTLATVCYASCTNCPTPVLVPVTFSVNMAATTIGSGGVHLAGSFNNFSRTATPMTLLSGTTYEATLQLDATLTVSYKFLKDTSNTGWEGVPAACSVNDGQGNFNRNYAVPSVAATISTVCFASCSNCVGVNIQSVSATEAGVAIYPNPTNDILNIKVTEKVLAQNSKCYIVDILGNVMMEFQLTTLHVTVPTFNLSSGVYFVKVGNEVKKIIKE